MSRDRALTRIHEELVCGICHDRLNRPKSLTQCSHSFCLGCLELVLASKSGDKDCIACPTCRKVTMLPQGKIEDLRTNHTLQNVAQIMSEVPEDQQPICEVHQSVLNQYCGTCSELLCSECIHGPKHKEHLQRGEIRLTREILPQRLEFLSTQIEPANELVLQVRKLEEDVEQKRNAVTSNGREATDEINSLFKEMVEQLEQRRKLLVSTVEGNGNDRLAVLKRHTKRLKEVHQSTVSTTDAIKRLCQCRDVRALTEGKGLETNLQLSQQTLNSLETQLQEQSLALVLKFQADRSLEQQISCLGALTVCTSDPNSTYLTVRHQLRVSSDGNVYVDVPPSSPTYQGRPLYMPLGPTDYVEDAYEPMKPLQAQFEPGRVTPTKPPPFSHSQPAGTYYDVLPSTSPPSPVPTCSVPRASARSPQLSHPYDPSASSQVGGNSTSTTSPCATSNGDEYENLTGEYKPMDIKETSRVMDAEPEDSGSDVGSEEGHYEVIPPPLPLDNLYRNIGKARQRDRSSTYSLVAEPTNRPEPEIIKPMQVINTDQLREPDSNDNVYPTGICVSSVDIITVTDMHNHCLRQIDQDGTFIQTFGHRGKSIWHFNSPTAVDVSADSMYVANHENSLVQKLTVDGDYVKTFGRRHLQSPRGIAVSQINGNVYVSDSDKRRVYVYQSDCTYQRPIGKREKNIQFDHPIGVAFDTAGNLLVVDRGDIPCVWYISQPEGELLGKFGEHYLHYPSDVAVTKDGSIVVTERGKVNCVSVFSPQGQVVRCFGKTGSKPGEFNGPSGIAVNSHGQIIVADQHNQRLQIFDLSSGSEVYYSL